MKITIKILRLVYGKRVENAFIDELHYNLNRYGTLFRIDTVKRLSRFMAQTKHEMIVRKNGKVVIHENLNYRPKQLVRFSRYFRHHPAELDRAMQLTGKTKRKYIATHWYGRGKKAKDLGNKTPLDGWRYRGFGILQVTGRYNTINAFKTVERLTGLKCFGEDGNVLPELINSYKGAILVSMAYWYMSKMYKCTNTACIIKKLNSGLPKKEKRERLATTIKVMGIVTAYA